MLTTAEVAAHLAELTYRPGWSLAVYDGRWEGQHLVITAEVVDSTHPERTTLLDVHSMLPPMRDGQALDEWLAWRLGRIEMHEMREMLRRDGRPIFDPHAPHADRDL